MPNTWGNGGVGEFAGGRAPSRKLSRTANRARPVIALLITVTKEPAPSGGLTARTLIRSAMTSTTPSPRMPFAPLKWMVRSLMVTGSEVTTSTAATGAPDGATITESLSPPTASRVSPLSITMASL